MKITKLVPRILYGEGVFDNLENLLDEFFFRSKGYIVTIIDSVHRETGVRNRLKNRRMDMVIDVDVSDHEPKTNEVDRIRDQIIAEKKGVLPVAVVGIGGGASMDIAKAVSIMLTNKGSSADYQGWDLVKEKAIPKVGVPTLSGTGSEATRTAVLTGPEKKLGINSDQSMFDAVLMDPLLLKTVDPQQEVYTGMDCFIHCVECLCGSFANEMARTFAARSKEAVENFFLKEKNYGELMIGSFFGGCSVANSGVGLCHALSYGISLILGYRHGMANSIVFNQLEEFYGKHVRKFKKMVKRNKIVLPKRVTQAVTPAMMDRMIEMTYLLKKDLVNALGENWSSILTRDKIIELYSRM